ncbi:hypothetical protein Pyn_01234 [Prunus yedoensis var. nudiflora]|uniref:Uncharacterized protein n=1 Tax=Prunus yedoensis var. nudiflora TaxID=2094558 RepID=A0A314XTK2_PRUYE|nr:hypothetical protein Pyn_01234 [Prunus yedoensis var. nudiflora]
MKATACLATCKQIVDQRSFSGDVAAAVADRLLFLGCGWWVLLRMLTRLLILLLRGRVVLCPEDCDFFESS